MSKDGPKTADSKRERALRAWAGVPQVLAGGPRVLKGGPKRFRAARIVPRPARLLPLGGICACVPVSRKGAGLGVPAQGRLTTVRTPKAENALVLRGGRAQARMRRKRMQQEDAAIIIKSTNNNNYTCSNDNYISGRGARTDAHEEEEDAGRGCRDNNYILEK